ncbi:hypothetical protein B0H17DRAFT_1005535 [Mycena rosella]|uniref:Uncharacterized protein n=1 Tax=Mycena rosella TaxID=1033263 RepID=A0AAD7DV13_MYCRO|nr:hypothetical protein B0H17DRAFT_1005535 [Mycena rosella]
MTDSNLYSRRLLSKGHGYPLFRPPPLDDLPEEYRQTGTQIGNVGFVTEHGYFDVIFSICAPTDDPINCFGVPEGFEVLDLGAGFVRECATHHRRGSDVSSTTILKQRLDVKICTCRCGRDGGATVEVLTSAKTAAILILPDGASRCDVRLRRLFEAYALKHRQSWYSFAHHLGLELDNGALYLVTGCDKSTSWNIATSQERSDSGMLAMKLAASECISAGVSYAWDWQRGSTAFTESGPRRRPGEEVWNKNQTVFFRGYKVAIQAYAFRKALAVKASSVTNAKPSHIFPKPRPVPATTSTSRFSSGLSSQATSSSAVSPGKADVQYVPKVTTPYHPSTALNEHLLNCMPNVTVVVTHDDVWTSVLNSNDKELPPAQVLLNKVLEKYHPRTASFSGHLGAAFTRKYEMTSGIASTMITAQEVVGNIDREVVATGVEIFYLLRLVIGSGIFASVFGVSAFLLWLGVVAIVGAFYLPIIVQCGHLQSIKGEIGLIITKLYLITDNEENVRDLAVEVSNWSQTLRSVKQCLRVFGRRRFLRPLWVISVNKKSFQDFSNILSEKINNATCTCGERTPPQVPRCLNVSTANMIYDILSVIVRDAFPITVTADFIKVYGF